MSNAKYIEKHGFERSTSGLLGAGIYLADRDKASQFALDRHGEAPALLEVRVTVRKPKFVTGDDSSWEQQGYDGCRAERTSLSSHAEWCIKSTKQIVVVGVTDLGGARRGRDGGAGGVASAVARRPPRPAAVAALARPGGGGERRLGRSEMDGAVAEAAAGIMAGRSRLQWGSAKPRFGYETDLSRIDTDFSSEAVDGPVAIRPRMTRTWGRAKPIAGYATDLSLLETDYVASAPSEALGSRPGSAPAPFLPSAAPARRAAPETGRTRIWKKDTPRRGHLSDSVVTSCRDADHRGSFRFSSDEPSHAGGLSGLFSRFADERLRLPAGAD